MIFFTILGWAILVVFALGLTFITPWLILTMAAFSCSKGEAWMSLVPFLLGGVALYGLFTHAPFHLVLS